MLNIASRGSGKTYTTCQMIKHYEKHKIIKDGIEYKLRTHLISPTIQANEIYQSLDSLDMKKGAHDDYRDSLLLNIIDDIKMYIYMHAHTNTQTYIHVRRSNLRSNPRVRPTV